MKIALKKFDEEDLEAQNFVKFRNKKHKLTGKQSITQLGLLTENESDPAARFENTDLNELYQMDYLDGLISGIKTGKEAAVYLGRNSGGLVAVKVYTDFGCVHSGMMKLIEEVGLSVIHGWKRRSNKGGRKGLTPIRSCGCRKSSGR